MKNLRVINRGGHIRHRLGVGFPPNKPVEIEVSERQYITINAVRDFEIEILENTPQENTDAPNSGDIDISDMNISNVLKLVKNGKLSVDEAIAKEVTGKNRTTLLEKLEQMKEGE